MGRPARAYRLSAFLAAASTAMALASAVRAEEAAAPAPDAAPALKPMSDGPLHEAFLSPRRDAEPPLVAKSPPPPVVERPAAGPPGSEARWVAGYWEWSAARDRFVWVTGTWRVPPPGRFWVNGLWKRSDDGWRRSPGFWSDRATDRIAFRKDGPPADRPADDPGAPPKPNCFYIPGQYVPDARGDEVVWRKGFWADAKAGWAWVPASWARQPEGWIFQEGYWDRPLEERGVLFAPAEVAGEPRDGEPLAFRPLTTVSPELYGQLYGAFGRSTPLYDGYPGVCYDAAGRYFAYADYGRLSPYYGYLDYPAYGGFGYPYYAAPIDYNYNRAYPFGTPTGLAYGLGLPYYGIDNLLLPLQAGYPIFGNTGVVGGGWGFGWPGWNGGPYTNWSGITLGTFPVGFSWGSYGWNGPVIGTPPAFGPTLGFPNWMMGWGNFGWGGLGWNGFNSGFPGAIWGGNVPAWSGAYPFANSGRRDPDAIEANHPGLGAAWPDKDVVARPPAMNPRHRDPAGFAHRGPDGLRNVDVLPPPASRPFAALGDRPGREAGQLSERHAPAFAGAMREAPGVGRDRPATWNHAFNGVAPRLVEHRDAARPAFDPGARSNSADFGRMRDGDGPGMNPGAGRNGSRPGGFEPQMHGNPVGMRNRPDGNVPSDDGLATRAPEHRNPEGPGRSIDRYFEPQLHARPTPAPNVANFRLNAEGNIVYRGMQNGPDGTLGPERRWNGPDDAGGPSPSEPRHAPGGMPDVGTQARGLDGGRGPAMRQGRDPDGLGPAHFAGMRPMMRDPDGRGPMRPMMRDPDGPGPAQPGPMRPMMRDPDGPGPMQAPAMRPMMRDPDGPGPRPFEGMRHPMAGGDRPQGLGAGFGGGERQPRGPINGGGFGAGNFNNGGMNGFGGGFGGMRDGGVGGVQNSVGAGAFGGNVGGHGGGVGGLNVGGPAGGFGVNVGGPAGGFGVNVP